MTATLNAVRRSKIVGSLRWNETAHALRAKPGKWHPVLVDVAKGNESYPIQRLRALGCECFRRQVNRRVTLFARYPK